MRTLVLSDLHLGLAGRRDRLGDPATLQRLCEGLAGVDRLVLLGDIVELRQGPVRDALSRALPILAELGAALGPGSEVVLVAGNHDHHLLDGWSARRGADGEAPPLGVESAVDWRPGEPLAAIATALGAAAVRGAYPGVWLREDVFALHGHYLDRHTTLPMLERLGAGAMTRVLRRPAAEATRAEDYEAVLAPLYAWMHATAQRASTGPPRATGASALLWQQLRRDGWRAQLVRAGFPLLIGALNRGGLGPLCAELDGDALRRAPLRAITTVLEQLEVSAPHVLFGHTHRAGPLPGDERSEWRTPAGTQLLNVGCWVHEPAFLGSSPTTSPYRAGFAGRLDDDGTPPRLVNLLD